MIGDLCAIVPIPALLPQLYLTSSFTHDGGPLGLVVGYNSRRRCRGYFGRYDLNAIFVRNFGLSSISKYHDGAALRDAL